VDKSVEVLTAGGAGAPEPGVEGASGGEAANTFAEVLAGVLGVDRVGVDRDFFEELGANSLVMAHFCARVRKRPDLPAVSMKDVYRHPTAAGLAEALSATARTVEEPHTPGAEDEQATIGDEATTATDRQYILCGAAQVAIFICWSYLVATAALAGYTWISDASGISDVYLRSVAVASLGFTAVCALPVAAKWLLIGRWTASEFPLWSLAYLRFWTVRSLLHANPMVVFVGTPIYVMYLRALGARIGKGVTILSPSVPVCTDLLTIGSGSVIRKDCFFLCYRANAGRIQTGRVTLGSDVYVGEKTVLDIDTELGDGAQLGHASALHRGGSVPAGERWHGSPAEPTDIDYDRVEPAPCGAIRRVAFGVTTLLGSLLVYLPVAVGGFYLVLTAVPEFHRLLDKRFASLTSAALYRDALFLSAALFAGFLVLGLAFLLTVPRILNLVMRPGAVYPLYGFHYSVHRAITRVTNLKFFAWLFGDSSYIVYYLQALGYNLSRVEQTGSNFGTEVHHETPYLVSIGSGTMVADGLSIINADFSNSSFRLSRVDIGPHNFLGNNIAYPAQGRTGDNCLLATKVQIPIDGEIREDVGLLGSPAFEIPRSVERDSRFDHLRTGDEKATRLAAKNRYNLRSMALFLLVRWGHIFGLTVIALATLTTAGTAGQLVVAVSLPLTLAFTAGYFVLVERVILRFGTLSPRLCSIYDPYFWWHERLWKVPDTYLAVFNGTPVKSLVWRMLGVRIGRRVFDDGCYITERTLMTIGDDCTLNHGSKLQCHSQEDGTFKSDRTALGAGSTLGTGAFIHYGVLIGEGALVEADSFLMKGEEVPPHAVWAGNPAEDTGRRRARGPASAARAS
jgi:non-ribosomal peptide synthetase-like protein